MKIDRTILYIIDGLESVQGNLRGKLYGAYKEECPAKRMLLLFWLETVTAQLKQLYEDAMPVRKQIAAEHAQTPIGQFLKTSKGKSGFQILMNLNQTA